MGRARGGIRYFTASIGCVARAGPAGIRASRRSCRIYAGVWASVSRRGSLIIMISRMRMEWSGARASILRFGSAQDVLRITRWRLRLGGLRMGVEGTMLEEAFPWLIYRADTASLS